MIQNFHKKIQSLYNENIQENETLLYCFPGPKKQGLFCTDKKVLILKSGFDYSGTIVTQIQLKQITGIKMFEPGGINSMFSLPYIEIQSASYQSFSNYRNVKGIVSAPNGIWFEKPGLVVEYFFKEWAFQLQQIIEEQVKPKSNPAPEKTGVNSMNDLERLAELYREGLLTESEFTAAKAKVIGG